MERMNSPKDASSLIRTLTALGSLALVACRGQVMLGSEPQVSHEAGPVSSVGDGGNGASGCGSAAVSFRTDIMPIFQQSCTLSSVCHGQMNNTSEENLYLGENGGATDAGALYGMLVGVPSKEDPSMNLVTAGDPANSYLWHKVVGDQNSLASGCAKAATQCTDCNSTQPCGGNQPYLGEMLQETDLCAIENWISQGARNN
jgi:hypothetical protein